MAEGKPLQVAQWGSNYICEQISSTKILHQFHNLLFSLDLSYVDLIYYLEAYEGQAKRKNAASFSNQVLTDQNYTT